MFDFLIGITKEDALAKHREMWAAMQEELGDNPAHFDRCVFKAWWTRSKKEAVRNNCYLCEYAIQQSDHLPSEINEDGAPICCKSCPINWPNGFCESDGINWVDSKISEILALPEKE